MDNLTRDVLEAERLGYGCHYGRYKADHPRTKPAPDDPEIPEAEQVRKCKRCGKRFVVSGHLKKFCSDSCRTVYTAEQNLLAKHRQIAKYSKKVCVLCGKEYQPTVKNQKFCGRSCAAKSLCGRPDQTCPVCGTRFHANRARTTYCSRACYRNRFTAGIQEHKGGDAK